ncbi:hypothetical protein [Micromonospora sp. NPDC003776]
MTEIAGSYRFLAWSRQGLAAAIPAGGPVGGDGTVRLPVTMTVRKGESDTEDVTRTLRLYGPGDVVGLDANQIIRREPRPGTADFEPNYFPLVEFDTPELPWLLSPEPSGERIRPWLTLVVVRRDVAEIAVDPLRPLPFLRLAPADAGDELPDLSESWAWAHGQIAGTSVPPTDALDGRSPELTLSRLLSPRRLRPRTAYLACLVPAYRAGVQAGLGQKVDAGADLAWPPPGGWGTLTGKFELPVYDHWEFATAEVGDFETLVRKLRPHPVGPDVGALPVDISTAGPDFADLYLAAPTVLPFEGALTSPALPDRQWPAGVQAGFAQRLEDLIEVPPGVDVTVLRPPIYGAFQAGTGDDLPEPGAGRPWLRDLNLDPGWRAAAALGVRVVQENQEQLMASAWEQAGELEKANALLRQAQLARSVASATRDKHLDGLPPDTAVRVTEPVHSRVRVGRDGTHGVGHTLRRSVHDSVFPQAALSAPFRRAVRPVGPLARRLPGPAQEATSALAKGLAKGTVKVPVHPARGGADFDEVGDRVAPPGQNKPKMRDLRDNVGNAAGWHKIAADQPGEGGFYVGGDPYHPAPPGPPDGGASTPAPPPATPLGSAAHVAVADPPVVAMAAIPNPRGGESRSAEPTLLPVDWVIDEIGRRADRLRGINNRFQAATEFLLGHLPATVATTVAALAPAQSELDLAPVADALVSPGGALEPDTVVPRTVLTLVPDAPAHPSADPLRPRSFTPRFPQPMSGPLASVDTQMMLPGIERIAGDSVGVLVGNTRFIEAYLAGLNHELSRELLWRGLPTDPGATFADRFWDDGGNPGRSTTPQLPPIADWAAGLGGNAPDTGGPDMLILVIRGRLLLRYPHTAVYAAKAVPTRDANGSPVLGPDGAPVPTVGTQELYPKFRGTIDPDVSYLGFDLTLDAARGTGGDLGWFFVVQEQPTAPRFGLDEPADTTSPGTLGSWSDLDWSDLVPAGTDLTKLRYAGVAGPLAGAHPVTLPVLSGRAQPTATWGADAAQMAAITYQRPMRVAIHARTVLPEATP